MGSLLIIFWVNWGSHNLSNSQIHTVFDRVDKEKQSLSTRTTIQIHKQKKTAASYNVIYFLPFYPLQTLYVVYASTFFKYNQISIPQALSIAKKRFTQKQNKAIAFSMCE